MFFKNLGKLLLGISLIFLFINPSFGQLAIIQDEDGYVNVRKEPSGKSEVITRLFDGDVFWFYENEESPWYEVSFYVEKAQRENSKYYEKMRNIEGKEVTVGYIHKSRILSLDMLPNIAQKAATRDKWMLTSNSLQIVFSIGDFNPEDHEISYYKENPPIISHINHKVPLGVDGTLPRREIQDVKIIWNNQELVLPRDEYNDLFQPNIEGLNVKKHKGYVYLTMLANSDGAGGYDCVWIFKDQKFVERYVNAP